MSTVPPGLLYLAIYNPTLKPSGPVIGDEEDAEEQAHILFYTGREQAVSRDKILRQVGLAKALINFTSMFTTEPCENAHSQTRRMLMLSPEPDFWIHVCVELAKTPRPVPAKPKGKAVAKEPTVKQELLYDYRDGSVNDLALKAQIMRGYELFKLTHGSFASILSSLGQQALELQLERFWTVWAWRWDLEDDMDFATHLGVSLHPAYRKVKPLLDTFTQEHLPDYATFALVYPHVVPSSSFLRAGLPGVLPQHILTRVPPPVPPPQPEVPGVHDTEMQPKDAATAKIADDKRADQTVRGHKAFSSLDMRNLKWMWSGLTFGKTSSSSAKPTAPPTPAIAATPDEIAKQLGTHDSHEVHQDMGLLQPTAGQGEIDVDRESLQEAISEENGFTQPSTPNPDAAALPRELEGPAEGETGQETGAADASAAGGEDDGQSRTSPTPPSEPSAPSEPPLEFLSTTVHLAKPDVPQETRRHKVWHATRDELTLAFIAEADQTPDLPSLGQDALSLFADIRGALAEEKSDSSEDPVTPVAKILAPKDKHIIASGPFTSPSPQGFSSKSEHLFNARAMLDSDFDIHEVFSRGQNPQHWHVARRGLNAEHEDGEVFMEVARKESTLTDVDNALGGVVRRFVQE